MDVHEFRLILKGAIAGNSNDVEKLIQLYMPLIEKYSYINGKYDEDLRQYILLAIVKNIKKFKI